MANVQIIGGGPAGLMAAYSASLAGHTVTLFEKNTQLGKTSINRTWSMQHHQRMHQRRILYPHRA